MKGIQENLRHPCYGKIYSVSSHKDRDEVVIHLKDPPAQAQITLSLTTGVINTLNLKPGSAANVIFFSPWPVRENNMVHINVDQKIATVRRDWFPAGERWVSLLYGNATRQEIQNIRDREFGNKTPPPNVIEAWSYCYRTPDDYREAQNIAVRNNFCDPHTIIHQIQTIQQADGSWIVFRYGPNCEARIRNSKDKDGNVATPERKEAWLHGFRENNEDYLYERRNNGVCLASGDLLGPFLAGYFYYGKSGNPEKYLLNKVPQGEEFHWVPVNIYSQKSNPSVSEYVGCATVNTVDLLPHRE